MEYEEIGRHYIQKTTMNGPDGISVQFFEVGEISELGRYKLSSDHSFFTREEALTHIERLTS